MHGKMEITVDDRTIGISTKLSHVGVADKMLLLNTICNALNMTEDFLRAFLAAKSAGMLDEGCVNCRIPHVPKKENDDDC